MKKVKIILLILLTCGLLYVGDMFLGNPVSYLMVKHHSQKYLQETYPAALQLQPGKIYHDWYNGGGYDIQVTSLVSRDTRFSLSYDRLGRLSWDGYDLFVASGNSTLTRLYEEYAALTEAALEPVIGENICKASLSTIDHYTGQPVPLPRGIDPKELVLDAEYDVAQLGREYGYLSLNLFDTPVSAETAAAHLTAIKDALDQAGVGFASVDLFLMEQDSRNPENSLLIEGISYGDLCAEDLPQRLREKAAGDDIHIAP